jgi:DNA polymerase elongation subunit (family B)
MSTLVLDIETTAPREHADACEEMAGERMDAAAFGALCPPLARVVCVCLAHLSPADEIVSELALYDTSALRVPPAASVDGAQVFPGEWGLLHRLNAVLSKATRIVTFNGAGFDVPTLLMRSMAHDLDAPVLLRAHTEYRYKPDLNFDLREAFTSFGRFRDGSLRAFALGMGLPDPKADGGGAHVSDLLEAGDAAGLVRYCQGDVRTTAALYRRWRVFTGQARRAA